jgi:serine/threonine protein kinase
MSVHSRPISDVPLAFPESLSRYQPLGQIGRGGMAEVILAEMQVGRGVTKLAVLKRIWPDLAADPEFASMFLNEARLCARMNHPNVVQTYELLEDAERPVIAMEYLDGQPLTRVLNRLVGTQTLGLTLRLRIIQNVLAALDYAHELTDYDGVPQGVVHRDVNPQNVFVTYAGQVKLVDFGLAKSLTGAYQTRSGSIRGKLAYMAPEQLAGGTVDRRTDVFAVGVMLWEMGAGRRLWQGMTEATIIRQLSSRIPVLPLGSISRLPQGLDKICARALSRDPADRYASAAEFAADVARMVPGNDDSHGRHLGKVVSLAFGEEREERRALIEAHLHRPRAPLGRPGGDTLGAIRPTRATPGAMWTVDAPEDISADMVVSIEDASDSSDASDSIDGNGFGPPVPPSVVPSVPTVSTRNVRANRVTQFVVGRGNAHLKWAAAGFACAAVLAGIAFVAGSVAQRGQPVAATHPEADPAGFVSPAGPVVERIAPSLPMAPVGAMGQDESVLQRPSVLGSTTTGAFQTDQIKSDAIRTDAGRASQSARGGRHGRKATERQDGTDDGSGTKNDEKTNDRKRNEAALADDAILQPTVDLSDAPSVVVAPTFAVAASTIPVAVNVPAAPDQAPPKPVRRSTRRPIDMTDPFAP